MNNIEMRKDMSSLSHDELANEILVTNYEYIESLQHEITFIKEEIERCRTRLLQSKNAKTSLMLTQQYKMLLSALTESNQNLAVNYMASYKPLNNLIMSREQEQNTIESFPQTETFTISDEFIKSVYKPYED